MLQSSTPAVVGLAASCVESVEVRRHIRAASWSVWLTAPVTILIERMTSQDHRRIIDRDELEELALRRRPHFEDVADVTIDVTGDAPETIVEMIVDVVDK